MLVLCCHSRMLPHALTAVVEIFVSTWFLMRIHFVMGCVAVVGTLSFLLMSWWIRRQRQLADKVRRKLTRSQAQVRNEAFNMLTTIKVFSREAMHTRLHSRLWNRFENAAKACAQVRALDQFVHQVWFSALLVVLLSQEHQDVSAGDLTAFFMLVQHYHTNFVKLRHCYHGLLRHFPNLQRFVKLMKEPIGMKSGCYAPSSRLSGELCLHNVSFEYPGRPGQTVLRNVSLTFRARTRTAIVGDSGAGKSTITKLLLRLYDPVHGQVTIDGVDLREWDVQAFRNRVAFVQQSPRLFDASIFDNIAYGLVEEDLPVGGKKTTCDVWQTGSVHHEIRQRVEAAAKLANCYDFIQSFRAGFDTFVGDAGAQLSGGQRQRIAIARAAVRNPDILILDEATSALDAANEHEVQVALENLMEGRTTIVIAHRLSTVMNCDEIVCMRRGKVVERGSHAELLGQDGEYATLVRHQVTSRGAESGSESHLQ